MSLFCIYGAIAESSTCIFTLSDSFQVLWIDTRPIMAIAFSDVIHHIAVWILGTWTSQFVWPLVCPLAREFRDLRYLLST